MNVRDFSKLYFGLLILHLAVIYKPESQALYLLSKPLLLFSLTAFFIHRTAGWHRSSKYWVIAALVLCLAADLLLLGTGTGNFYWAVIAFGVAHLAYSGFYFSQSMHARYAVIVPVAVLLAVGIYLLYNYVNLPSELTPLLYGIAVVAAVHLIQSLRFALNGKGLLRLPAIGTALFILFNVFLIMDCGDKYSQMFAVTVYAVGQYLIVAGILAYAEKEQ